MLLTVLVILLAVFVAWHFFPRKENKPVDDVKDKPLFINSSSSKFDQAFAMLMSDYFSIHDALVDSDTGKANLSARRLQLKADSLPFAELKGDTSIIQTATYLSESISNEMKAFVGEDSIGQKLRSFNMLTDEMYNIIRTVRYAGQKIYYIRCATAFNNTDEGYWLSNENKIVNPYAGSNDPAPNGNRQGCGQIVDSLDFSKK